MLELQMKETMQLLGINNNNNIVNDYTNDIRNYTTEIDNKNSSSFNSFNTIEKMKTNYFDSKSNEVDNSISSPTRQKIEEFHLNTLRELNTMNFENKRDQSVFELNNGNINSAYKLETSSPKQQMKTPKFNESNVSVINKVKPSLAPSNSIADLMNSLNYSQTLSNKLNQSPNTPPSVIQTSGRKSLVENQKKIEIKDNFILDQIDIINKYYKIDDKTLAAASNLNLDKSNLSLNASVNEKSNSLKKHSLSNYNSNINNSCNNYTSETTILNETNCFNSQICLTDNFKKFNRKETTKELSRFKMAKSMLNIFQDDEKRRNMDFNEQKQKYEDNNSILATERIRSYSSNDQNEEISNLNNTTMNNQQNPNRANELRHFIEILLNRSPTSEKNSSKVKEGQ